MPYSDVLFPEGMAISSGSPAMPSEPKTRRSELLADPGHVQVAVTAVLTMRVGDGSVTGGQKKIDRLVQIFRQDHKIERGKFT